MQIKTYKGKVTYQPDDNFLQGRRKSQLNRNFSISHLSMLILIATMFVLAFLSCKTAYLVPEPSGYMVTVETKKPKNIEVLKLQQTSSVDSVVNQNFGFAIKGFASDSMFKVSPYYRIETLNKTVYSEAKNKRKFKNYNR